MPGAPLNILLVEDNSADAEYMETILEQRCPGEFCLTHVEQFQEAVACSHDVRFDLVLLDLSLPDSFGLYTVARAREEIPSAPIVVLTGMDDETTGMKAIEAGAQDYLVKGRMDDDLLVRSLRYAAVRYALQENVHRTSLTDELTGLYNRRGFLERVEEQRKVIDRTEGAFLLLFMDMDGFKQINDTFGHHEGDCALKAMAEILRNTFRNSDLTARYGGDEFVVAALSASEEDSEMLLDRLQQNVMAYNEDARRVYPLLLSIGLSVYHAHDSRSIEELITEADTRMYLHKRRMDTAGGKRTARR